MSAVGRTAEGLYQDRSRLAVTALLAAGLLWGLTWIPLKYFGSQGLNGITLTMMSYGLVGLLALPWVLYRRSTWWPQRNLVLMIAIAGGLANVCFLSAIVRGEVVRVMLLFYLAPVWGVLGGRIFFGEPLTRLRVLGVATAWGVSHMEAGRAAILLVFELVAAVVSAMWIAGERLGGTEWIGAVMIVAAALLETRPAKKSTDSLSPQRTRRTQR
jgi:drug/metabolite transporter (DMT)-like permease